MGAKQKYEIRYNEKRKKFEALKGGSVILSSDSQEKIEHIMLAFKNYPFVCKTEIAEVQE